MSSILGCDTEVTSGMGGRQGYNRSTPSLDLSYFSPSTYLPDFYNGGVCLCKGPWSPVRGASLMGAWEKEVFNDPLEPASYQEGGR